MKKNLSLIEESVLACIPKKKPLSLKEVVSRRDISKITGLTLREVSYVIEELRKYYPICSSRGSIGFWIGNKSEALTFANECRNHAKGLIETAENIEAMFDDEMLV